MRQHFVIFWGKLVISIACCFQLSAALQCVGAREPCVNNATCIAYSNGTGSCRCPAGFWGQYCQYPDPCLSGPCLNGGTCTISDVPGLPNCSCPSGFSGHFCDHHDGCASSPCKHGARCLPPPCLSEGSCWNASLTGYQCQCLPGFSGLNCETITGDCSVHGCHNGGTCIKGLPASSCQCPPQWTGLLCTEGVDKCQLQPGVCQNSGTCVNFKEGYRCICVNGWKGADCSEPIDDCASRPCFSGSTCFDLVASFKCVCPIGRTGLQCETKNTCISQPCQNNAECDIDPVSGNFNCICSSGYEGITCSEDINECTIDSSPCEHGGLCVNTQGSFTCNCTRGYSGPRCEENINECLSSPCHNSATCLDNIGSYFCICMPGFTGVHCEQEIGKGGGSQDHIDSSDCPPGRRCESVEDPCLSNPCPSGGICSANNSASQGFTCTCRPGFSGPDCGQVVAVTCLPLTCLNGGTCQETPGGNVHCLCPARFSGQRCESAKSEATLLGEPGCVGDGNACSPQWSPWHGCTSELRCRELFNNGACDRQCNTAACLFDGFECQAADSPCRYNVYCTDHYADKYCDPGCNTEACGWDGLDCADSSAPQLAEGTLVVVLLVPPTELLPKLAGLLRSLGLLLHTNLRVRRNANGTNMVLPYYSSKSQHINKQQEQEVIGSRVFLEIDNRQCATQAHSSCFTTADQAASFLSAPHLKSSLAYPLLSAESVVEPNLPVQTNMLYLIAVVLGPALFVLVVLVAKRKRKHTTLWVPEGFPINSHRRRDPVGQDDMDLKDIMKPIESGPVNTGLDQQWLHESAGPRKLKMEDKSLLPAEEGAAECDLREWAPQHRRAAELTLIPPQAELNSMDVNIRGPDGLTPLMLASVCHGVMLDCDSLLEEEEEDDAEQEAKPNIITELVALGATLQAQTDGTGETALHLAARYARADATKRLLDAGADANAQDRMGRTPLHAAVAADAQGVFQILIRNRATDLNAHMHDGTTPLILAARLAVEGIVEQLAHCHADINAVDDHGKSALHWAAAVNNVEAVLILVKNGANRDLQDLKEETPLFLAAREGSFDAARVLLDHCCSRDITDHLDRLPHDVARERMHHDIVQLLDHYNVAPASDRQNGRGLARAPVPPVCGSGTQGKKGRRASSGRAAGEEVKFKRKKPSARMGAALMAARRAGGNCTTVMERLSRGSSPVECLESPHTVTTVTATPPLLMTTPPVHMPLLTPVTHMSGHQQQAWKEQGEPGFGPHLCRLRLGQFEASHPEQYSSLDVPVAHKQLSPILAFQMTPRESAGTLLDPGQAEALSQPEQGALHPCFTQSVMMGVPQPLAHTLSFGQSPGEAPALRPTPHHESPMDKFPTPPSQRSYATAGLDGATPAPHIPLPTEHPYLTPSPESPEPWSSSSSSSPHSASDWSDVTTSPAPRHLHVPWAGPLPAQQPHPQNHSRSSIQTHP